MDKIVFVLLGKTGSGKSTILNMIQDVHGVDLPKLASYTSRPRRSNEEKSNDIRIVLKSTYKPQSICFEPTAYTQILAIPPSCC